MPPKPKYTKEEIIDAAFEIVRQNGADSLTARELGKRLSTSPSPIFTVFRDMEELRDAVSSRAVKLFNEYMSVADEYFPAYKKRGMQWVKFAAEEPKLFQFLFMQTTGNNTEFDTAICLIPFGMENDIEIIERDYNATPEAARHMFRQMWTYTYGLCVLSSMKVCSFTEDEVVTRLGEIFAGMIHVMENPDNRMITFNPIKKNEVPEIIMKKSPDLGNV